MKFICFLYYSIYLDLLTFMTYCDIITFRQRGSFDMYTEDNRDFDEEYEEEDNRSSFPYTKLIIKILIIFVCLLLAIWIISKLVGGSRKAENKNDGTIFNNNIQELKKSAEEYFFNDNLPQNIGDTKTISLGELNSLNKIKELRDYNDKVCSKEADKSYASITRKDLYYELKVKLTCDEENKEYIYYYELENNNEDNNDDNEIYDLNINCKTWTEWTDKKLNDNSLLVRTRTLIKGYKIIGEETITYGPWTEWTNEVINSSDTLEVETKEELDVIWSENKTTTSKISNSDTIKIIDTKTTNNGTSCYNKTTYENAIGTFTQSEYTKLEAKGLIVSLKDSYWVRDNNGYHKEYKAVYKKETTKKVCSDNYVTTYTYQELITANVIKYRSRTITKGLINTKVVYTDYVETLPKDYIKVDGSEKTQYSYKTTVCK